MSYKDKMAPLEELVNYLQDKEKETLLSFIAKTKTKPHWYATNSFNVKYKNRILYRFHISEKGYWTINLTLANPIDLDKTLLSLPNELQDFYFKNLRRCKHCNPNHGNGKRFVILGNEYFGCAEPEVEITNPSVDDIIILTKLTDVRRENILDTSRRLKLSEGINK